MNNERNQSRWYQSPLTWIMGGLFGWGTYLAIGGYLAGGQRALQKAGLIMGCTLVFLLIWLAVLFLRRRRNAGA